MSHDSKIPNGHLRLRKVAPKVLSARFDAMMAHAAATRAGTDPEALHDMRVASRRLRAALDALGACYDSKSFRRVAQEAKSLTRALGAVRDEDVLLESLHAYTESIPEDERPALTRFITHLETTRGAHREALVRHLDTLDASKYANRFHRAVKSTT